MPLCLQQPPPEWEHVISDCKPEVVLCHTGYLSQLAPLTERRSIRLVPYGDFFHSDDNKQPELPNIDGHTAAQIIYTSGTTGRPKGAIIKHEAIHAQIKSLSEAWEWSEKDHILETLPLNHLHGNIVALSTALYSGAKVTFHSKFDQHAVWKTFMSSPDLNLFMGVPTMYTKLIQGFKEMSKKEQADATKACEKFRLMVSGSMALPQHTLKEWENISHQMLLERYGMTECGMILSNPYKGIRKPGYVGKELPGVTTRIVASELRVKSPGLFSGYLHNTIDSLAAFDEEGWFKTGDIVTTDEDGDHQIVGRASVDIIKSGGFKISTREVENDLLDHPDINEVCIVGVPDEAYGECVAAVVVSKQKISLQELQNWSRTRMAAYKTPRMLLQVDELPRNHMGKVIKRELVHLFTK